MADPDVQGGLQPSKSAIVCLFSPSPLTEEYSYLYTAEGTLISFMFRKIKSKCKIMQSQVMRVCRF